MTFEKTELKMEKIDYKYDMEFYEKFRVNLFSNFYRIEKAIADRVTRSLKYYEEINLHSTIRFYRNGATKFAQFSFDLPTRLLYTDNVQLEVLRNFISKVVFNYKAEVRVIVTYSKRKVIILFTARFLT